MDAPAAIREYEYPARPRLLRAGAGGYLAAAAAAVGGFAQVIEAGFPLAVLAALCLALGVLRALPLLRAARFADREHALRRDTGYPPVRVCEDGLYVREVGTAEVYRLGWDEIEAPRAWDSGAHLTPYGLGGVLEVTRLARPDRPYRFSVPTASLPRLGPVLGQVRGWLAGRGTLPAAVRHPGEAGEAKKTGKATGDAPVGDASSAETTIGLREYLELGIAAAAGDDYGEPIPPGTHEPAATFTIDLG